jgi:deoxyhypusine synthase
MFIKEAGLSWDMKNARRYGFESKIEKAKKVVFLEPAESLEGWPEIKGYDFEGKFSFDEFLKAYAHTGFQASELYKAIVIARKMREENALIILAYTSNMATCGVREQIRFLAKNSLVDVLITTTGGLEEDIIRGIKPFVLGSYDASGRALREKGINRTGNIFIPNDRYLYFERLANRLLKRAYAEKKVWGVSELAFEFGRECETEKKGNKEFDAEGTIAYWAYRNKIPYFVLPMVDGSIGDIIYFFKKSHPDFVVDESSAMTEAVDLCLGAEKTGVIAVGGSVPKHLAANANLFRDGADYAVYINTAGEYEGSNAGANPDEAVSWGKFSDKESTVKVCAEASLVFPLFVAGAFALAGKRANR